jgi:hypothetical protein
MQVSGDQGKAVATAACGLRWGTTVRHLDRAAFPLLGALDPYRDAVFDHRRIPALLEELDRLPTELGGAWVSEVRTLCAIVLEKPDLQLWFIGD